MSVLKYDPKLVLASFATPLSGFAPGTFIEIDRSEDAFETVVGADGEVARVRNRNASGIATVTLMQTSKCNDILSALFKSDMLFGTGVVPFMVRDLNGRTNVFAPDAWIAKPAPTRYGKALEDRVWVIALGEINELIGGN